MRMNHIGWALVGMAGYSATTLFMKLATRSGDLSAFRTLAIAVSIVIVSVWTVLALREGIGPGTWKGFTGHSAAFALLTGVALAIAVISLFRALSMGPASVVVPIYGMFILGGAVLGMIFLDEPVTLKKALGLLLAVVGVVLVAA